MDNGRPTTFDEAVIILRKTGANRTDALRAGFVRREVPEEGTGIYSVNAETGEVCQCDQLSKWTEDGELLICTGCFVDGT